MKKAILFLLCALIAVSALAACSDNAEKGVTFTVMDEGEHETVTATFMSTDSGEQKEIRLNKNEKQGDYTEFTCAADPEKYDRVIITTDNDSTPELAYNSHVLGWVLNSQRFYPYDKVMTEPEYKRMTFDYEDRTKDVLIWTPEDYDPESSEKYSVIYMTDGQNLFKRSATSTGSWGVAESVRAMMENGGEKCIIVGVENSDGWRDSELTPDIGEVTQEDYKNGKGDYFCDFVVNTVMNYVNLNYNVYTDREHTSVCGSSSGGIESFYIAMEHPELFGSVGALSPAFLLYDDNTWAKYLGGKDFSEGYPTVYLYCGNSSSDSLEQALYSGTVAMPATLKKIGYPEDKVTMKLCDSGVHNEMYWRAVFPDYLKYCFPKSAPPESK